MLLAILGSMAVTALVLMLAFPETPAGKWLHRSLVEPPARFFTDFTWAKLAKTLLLGAALVVLALMGPEMMLVLGASGLDAAALIEVMFIVWLASVSGGIATVWRVTKRVIPNLVRLARSGPRNRSRARRSRKPQRKTDDKNEPGWAFA